MDNTNLLPIVCCPFCGREFSVDHRIIIAKRLKEQDENGNYIFPEFRIICSECHGEIKLFRTSDYFDDESVPPT